MISTRHKYEYKYHTKIRDIFLKFLETGELPSSGVGNRSGKNVGKHIIHVQYIQKSVARVSESSGLAKEIFGPR